MCVCTVAQSCLFETLWTIAHQPPLSMGLFRREYWSGLPFPSPAVLPDPRIKPTPFLSAASQADSLPTELWYRISKNQQALIQSKFLS